MAMKIDTQCISKLRSRLSRDGGASFVEFSLVAFFFVLLVLAIIQIGIYYQARMSLAKGLEEGLSLASVIPGLETPGNELQYDPAIASVAQEALRFPSTTFFTNETNPEGNGTASGASRITELEISIGDEDLIDIVDRDRNLSDLFNSEPIHIRASGFIRNIIWFLPEIPITVRAVGYREPRFFSTFPRAVDCHGKEASLRMSADAPDTPDYCTCPTDPDNPFMYLDPFTRNCNCQSLPNLDQESCECYSPFVPSEDPLGCVCPEVPCPEDMPAMNHDTCTCMECEEEESTCGICEEQDPPIPTHGFNENSGQCGCILTGSDCAQIPAKIGPGGGEVPYYFNPERCACRVCNQEPNQMLSCGDDHDPVHACVVAVPESGQFNCSRCNETDVRSCCAAQGKIFSNVHFGSYCCRCIEAHQCDHYSQGVIDDECKCIISDEICADQYPGDPLAGIPAKIASTVGNDCRCRCPLNECEPPFSTLQPDCSCGCPGDEQVIDNCSGTGQSCCSDSSCPPELCDWDGNNWVNHE